MMKNVRCQVKVCKGYILFKNSSEVCRQKGSETPDLNEFTFLTTLEFYEYSPKRPFRNTINCGREKNKTKKHLKSYFNEWQYLGKK